MMCFRLFVLYLCRVVIFAFFYVFIVFVLYLCRVVIFAFFYVFIVLGLNKSTENGGVQKEKT